MKDSSACMAVRAARGATTVVNNVAEEILAATREMLVEIIDRNNIDKEDIISILFTVTRDLDAVFPAAAARGMGLVDVALMCTNEIPVPGSLERCIRVMLHFNTGKSNKEIRHVFLRGAEILRPDLK